MKLSIIAAVADNGVIGRDNTLPWHLSEDLKHFREVTSGHAVIMGRKTFESIARPLPNRQMIAMTRDGRGNGLFPKYVEAANSLEQALALCKHQKEAFIIGGAEIYRLAMPLCQRLIVTEIDIDPMGDAWFASPEPDDWIRQQRSEHISKTGLHYSINLYQRRSPGEDGNSGQFA